MNARQRKQEWKKRKLKCLSNPMHGVVIPSGLGGSLVGLVEQQRKFFSQYHPKYPPKTKTDEQTSKKKAMEKAAGGVE
jgi:hypothetical protein